MFGSGRKRKYFAQVDTKLNNEYQIDTRNDSRFPGALRYLELVDAARGSKQSEDEGAMMIAVMYYCGILRHGHYEDAERMYSRIRSISSFCLPKGMISQRFWEIATAEIEKAQRETQTQRATAEAEAVQAHNQTARPAQGNLSDAEAELKREFDLSINGLREKSVIHVLFIALVEENSLSHEASVAMLFRAVALDYLGTFKAIQDTGVEIPAGNINWAISIINRSVEWSKQAPDRDIFELVAASLNKQVVDSLALFDVHVDWKINE